MVAMRLAGETLEEEEAAEEKGRDGRLGVRRGKSEKVWWDIWTEVRG